MRMGDRLAPDPNFISDDVWQLHQQGCDGDGHGGLPISCFWLSGRTLNNYAKKAGNAALVSLTQRNGTDGWHTRGVRDISKSLVHIDQQACKMSVS